MNQLFMDFVVKGICECKATNTKIDHIQDKVHLLGDENRNESDQIETNSAPDRSNSMPQKSDYVYTRSADPTSSHAKNTTNGVILKKNDDCHILSLPDSIHPFLTILNDNKLTKVVCIKEWSMLEALIINDNCGNPSESLIICDCPKLKSIKIGIQCFIGQCQCKIQSILSNE